MTLAEWALKDVDQLIRMSDDYREKALLLALKELLLEQTFRLEQFEGELDGTLWSPREWRS